MRERNHLIAPFALALLSAPALHAQVPTKCLEIESILVDACISETDCPGSSEGMNEMVRFITGPAPIAIGDLQFGFYSSTFRGIAQNSATADLTAQLNASIQGCGRLLEPPGGSIPAGSRVIFATSTAMCVQANSFTALNDTLYIIFQAPGNSQGHFKNNDLVGQPVTAVPAAPLMRWLRIDVNGTACGDTATYDANQLVNAYGSFGGLSEENDGATAEFSWPGAPVASYVNFGCQAPFTPMLASVVSGGGPIACGTSADLLGAVTGPHASVHWQGGGGYFSQPDSLGTTYTPGGGDNGDVVLSFCAISACGDTTCGQATVTTGATPNVIVSGDTTLCGQFATSVLTASGADNYLWSTGASGPTLLATITGPMNYWVAGTNACGSDTAHIAPRWMHTTTYYTNVSCNGGADGILSAGGSGGVWPYTYLWSNGSTDSAITGLTAGYYSYTIMDSDGCTMTGGTTLTQPAPLTVIVGGDTAICAGGTVELHAAATGGTPGYYYAWSPEGPLVSPTETTTYTLETHDLNGCEAAPQEVTVSVAGTAVVVTASDTAGCAPRCITFTASSTAVGAYTWDFGDGGTASDSVVQHCFTEEGAYTVTVQADQGGGCPQVGTSIGPVAISAVPVADFSWTPEVPVEGGAVQFTADSPGATTWAWAFGDSAASAATGASPVFTFPGSGCYPVELVVGNDAGCPDTTLRELCIPTVEGNDSLTVPNVFSPNGDGVNDQFRITGGPSALAVRVFNRWGQEVARLERPGQAWDGRSPAGEALPEGTYFYVLHAVERSGKAHDLRGTVTLLR